MTSQATRLRMLIDHLGVSDREFARKIGVSATLVNRVLGGDRATDSPSSSIVLGAFKGLGLRPDYWQSKDPPAKHLGTRPDDLDVDMLRGELPGVLPKAHEDEDANDLLLYSDEVRRLVIDVIAGRRVPPTVIPRLSAARIPEDRVEGWLRLNRRHPGLGRSNVLLWWLMCLLDSLKVPHRPVDRIEPRATAQSSGDAETDRRAHIGEMPDVFGWKAVAAVLSVSESEARRFEREGLPIVNVGKSQVAGYEDRLRAWQRERVDKVNNARPTRRRGSRRAKK
jgi:transcriptional regulator with XRE-family HTH domain